MTHVHSEIENDVILQRARNFGFANADENAELKQNLIRFARAVIQDDRDLADTYEKPAAKPKKGAATVEVVGTPAETPEDAPAEETKDEAPATEETADAVVEADVKPAKAAKAR